MWECESLNRVTLGSLSFENVLHVYLYEVLV